MMEDGGSFSALCNAVELSELTSPCYAVQAWLSEQGSPRSWDAADSVVAGARNRYFSFAAFLAGPPEPLASLFASNSIDLLHLGAPHTYASIEALYQTWLPKLSDHCVVLIDNTLDHKHDGGIRRFWKDICHRHPSFEFHHSRGLGIVAPGLAAPEFVTTLAGLAPAEGAALRLQVAALAERRLVDAGKARTRAGADTQALDDSLPSQVALLREQLLSSVQEADLLRLYLEGIRTSASWRAMGPYRVLGRLLKRRIVTPLKTPRWQRQQSRDFTRISRSESFDASFYLGRESPPEHRNDVIRQYLAASRRGMPRGSQNPGFPPRRPLPGFHPLAYAAQCRAYDETKHEDPLAHYLRTGMPEGPWKHQIIQPHTLAAPGRSGLRILIHAHFHYPDLLPDLLRRLRLNASAVDLLITTTSGDRAAVIEDILAAHDAKATTLVVPNLGRNIGPLLMHFDKVESYDIVGHLHGKRSPQQGGTHGDNWRTFLWDHLVGNDSPMVDVIADAFAADARLGIVLAEDPDLNHWDLNASFAEALASRLGLREPLPPHFEFPKGTMFYARPAALRPLVDLGWTWSDFPAEPVKSDGTVLHALERMFAFSAGHAGFVLKAVNLPNSLRLPVV